MNVLVHVIIYTAFCQRYELYYLEHNKIKNKGNGALGVERTLYQCILSHSCCQIQFCYASPSPHTPANESLVFITSTQNYIIKLTLAITTYYDQWQFVHMCSSHKYNHSNMTWRQQYSFCIHTVLWEWADDDSIFNFCVNYPFNSAEKQSADKRLQRHIL